MSETNTSKRTLRNITPEAIEAAARADSDAQPLSLGDLKRMKRTPQAKIIRRALGLTQEEFSAHYHIPLGTLRDWEQGRRRAGPTHASVFESHCAGACAGRAGFECARRDRLNKSLVPQVRAVRWR